MRTAELEPDPTVVVVDISRVDRDPDVLNNGLAPGSLGDTPGRLDRCPPDAGRVGQQSLELTTLMKIRAQIIIDLDVEDYVAAAGHQRRIEDFFRHIRADYSEASLQLGEVRPRAVMRMDDRRRQKRRSGNLAVYRDD